MALTPRELAAAKAASLLAKDKCRKNPHYFLEKWVRTLDQTDQVSPIKDFPAREDMPHPYILTDIWLKHKLLIVPKSRRMLCSWLFCALYTWDAAFFEGRHNFIGSKKDDDAGELIDRCEFMLDPLASKGIVPSFRRKNSPHEIKFKGTNSKITGFPSGPDQLRQYTASGVLLDEAAFHDDLEKTLMAAGPTLLGGGRMTLISSVNAGSYMEKMVFGDADELEERERAA